MFVLRQMWRNKQAQKIKLQKLGLKNGQRLTGVL
jgi:hypothetical protein